jgi:hypothetical protein
MNTKAYDRDCNRVFGHYFHHFPYFGLRGEEDVQNLKQSFEQTKNFYFVTFGEPIDHSSAAGAAGAEFRKPRRDQAVVQAAASGILGPPL